MKEITFFLTAQIKKKARNLKKTTVPKSLRFGRLKVAPFFEIIKKYVMGDFIFTALR